MIKSLFIKELKSSYKLLIGIMGILTMYITMIVAMYDPSILELLEEFNKTMPDIMAMFNMNQGFMDLNGFVVNYLYGFLFLAFPLVLTLVLSNKLIARYIENNEMSCLLIANHSRKSVALTQMFVMLSFISLLFIYTFIILCLSIQFMFPSELDIIALLNVHFGCFIVHVCVASFAFCVSCLSTDLKKSYVLSIGVPLFGLVVSMIANIGNNFDWLKYLNIFTLFNPQKLLVSEGYINILILVFISVLLLFIGIKGFINRDISV